MNITVTSEFRFERTPDGLVWTPTVSAYRFWARYLEVFDQVRVLARVRDVSRANPLWIRADGEGVTFSAVPYYVGPLQYCLKFWQVRSVVHAAIVSSEAVMLRVPGEVGSIAYKRLGANNHPFSVEVCGDPYEVFAPGVLEHPLRSFFRWWFVHQLRNQCLDASAVAYVSEMGLPDRYPPAQDAVATFFSSIELKDEAFIFSDVDLTDETAFAFSPRHWPTNDNSVKIVTVGSLAQMYKGPDLLIEAVAKCSREGLNCSLKLIGEGKYRAELEARVKALGLAKRVSFLGQLPGGEAVRMHLDQADLFVLPSRTDALPRAMIEAMARGLPCLGTTVGGIPELLPYEDMVPPNDAGALARKIQEVTADPMRMIRMSARNIEKAKEYREEILHERRVSFYKHVRRSTEAWLSARH